MLSAARDGHLRPFYLNGLPTNTIALRCSMNWRSVKILSRTSGVNRLQPVRDGHVTKRTALVLCRLDALKPPDRGRTEDPSWLAAAGLG